MDNGLFRKKSMDRISSPEALHDYMRVTSPRLWMILAAIVLLLGGFVVYASTAKMENTIPLRVTVETYHMTAEEASTKATSREDNFRPDPEIPTGSATLADYRGFGYDRGHLAPAADMAFSFKTMDESFYMSNMSPQRPEFNRGIWKDLEAQVRSFAITEGDIYVVTGPILPQKKSLTIGPNEVTVPGSYYKVVWDRTPPEKMIGFILPNAGSSESLKSFTVSVDEVEQKTGLDFFSLLPKEQQEALESNFTIDAWKWQ